MMKINKFLLYSLLIVFSIISFVFYHFIVFPLFLDYGINGVFVTIMLLILLVWLVPKDKRMRFSVLFIGYLLLVRGMYHVGYKTVYLQVFAFICLTLMYYVVTRILAGKIRFTYILTISLVGAVLFSLFDQEELFFAKKFQVVYKSPKLFSDTNVDYFPLQLADVTGDGLMEIITQGFTEDELDKESEKSILGHVTYPGKAAMQIEPSRYLVYKYFASSNSNKYRTSGSLIEVGGNALYQDLIKNYVIRDYAGFPYYQMSWSDGANFIHNYSDIRSQLLGRGMLQMDFFYNIKNEASVDNVDKLWINPLFLELNYQALDRVSAQVVGNGDNLSTSVDKSPANADTNANAGTNVNAGIYEILIPTMDRLHLIQTMLPFGKTAFAALELSKDNIAKQVDSWNKLKGNNLTESTDGNLIGANNTDIAISASNADTLLAELIPQLEAEGAKIIGRAKIIKSDNSAELNQQANNVNNVAELIVQRDGLEVYQYRQIDGRVISQIDSRVISTVDGEIDDEIGAAINSSGKYGWVMVAKLTPNMLSEIANGEVLLADINNDGISEILLSATPSQILRLVPRLDSNHNQDTSNILAYDFLYDWEQMWVAQDEIFRFETVTDDGLILALSQSYKRNEARRFLTAYKFVNGTAKNSNDLSANYLQPVWRTNNTVINVRTGDMTGDGNKEIVASLYRQHQFVVLREHGLPVTMLAWLISIIGFAIVGSYRYLIFLNTGYRKNKMQSLLVSCLIVVLLGLSLYSISDNRHISAIGLPNNISTQAAEVNKTNLFAENSVPTDRLNGELTNELADELADKLVDGWQDYLLNAIDYTDKHGEKFWYSGWVATKVQKRQTNSMYDGIVVRDNANGASGIMVNARLLGQPFSYYEFGENVYIHENNQWQRLQNEAGYPVDWLSRYGTSPITEGTSNNRMNLDAPFAELSRLADLSANGYKVINAPEIVAEEMILASLCNKVEFVVADDNAVLHWSIWIGKDEPYIYQYKVDTILPIPSAGSMKQTTYFRFWNYNDDSIKLTAPKAIEKQIVQRELNQIKDIEYSLTNENAREELTSTELKLLELRLKILQNNVERSHVKDF